VKALLFVYTHENRIHGQELDMKTTINMRRDSLKALATVAQSRGISRSKMAIILLKKEMAGVTDPGCIGTLVRYQKRARPEEWHKFHVRFRPDEYEYFQDLRRLCKFSISYILQRAIKKHISKNRGQDTGDNYLFTNYLIIKDIIDNITCWKFYWGIPPGIEKILKNKHPA
jgi:hypothetical protein